MTKLLIEKVVLDGTRKTRWKATAWYGEECWHVALTKSLQAAMTLAAEWVESDAVYTQPGGAE